MGVAGGPRHGAFNNHENGVGLLRRRAGKSRDGAGALHAGGGQASWLWLLGYFVVITIGELYLSPVGLSLVTKVAPARILSMMMGVWLATSLPAGSSRLYRQFLEPDGEAGVFSARCRNCGACRHDGLRVPLAAKRGVG